MSLKDIHGDLDYEESVLNAAIDEARSRAEKAEKAEKERDELSLALLKVAAAFNGHPTDGSTPEEALARIGKALGVPF